MLLQKVVQACMIVESAWSALTSIIVPFWQSWREILLFVIQVFWLLLIGKNGLKKKNSNQKGKIQGWEFWGWKPGLMEAPKEVPLISDRNIRKKSGVSVFQTTLRKKSTKPYWKLIKLDGRWVFMPMEMQELIWCLKLMKMPKLNVQKRIWDTESSIHLSAMKNNSCKWRNFKFLPAF